MKKISGEDFGISEPNTSESIPPTHMLEEMPPFGDYMDDKTIVKESPKTPQEMIRPDEFTTAKEAMEAIRNLEQQLTWERISNDLLESIETTPFDETDDDGIPLWMRRFTTGSHDLHYPPERGYEYVVSAITTQDYNERDSNELPRPEEKRIIIKPEYGYTQFFFADQKIKNINGFIRLESEEPFIEEIDFTFGNKESNKDIPERMNSVLMMLFGKNVFSEKEEEILSNGDEYEFDYLEYKEFPDGSTVLNARDELRKIIEDIGEDDVLKEKKKILKKRWDELVQEEDAARKREELNLKRKDIPRVEKMVDDGQNLSLQDLKVLFDEGFDEDEAVQRIRNKLGIDANVIKTLLKK